MKRVLLKAWQPAIVALALCVASIAFSLGTYAMPISAPAALGGASNQISLAEAVRYGYYGFDYYRPYADYRPHYRHYGYYRPYRYYRPYFSYPYRLPRPVH
jgi:hypothetical protein